MSRRCTREGVDWSRKKRSHGSFGSNGVNVEGDLLANRAEAIGHPRHGRDRASRWCAHESVRAWHYAIMRFLRRGEASRRRGLCSGSEFVQRGGDCEWHLSFTPMRSVYDDAAKCGYAPSRCTKWRPADPYA